MSRQLRPELVERRGSTDTASTSLIVQDASGLLAVFNQAGILNPADVHTAATVCRIGGEADESVRLALALTVRALRNGSVCIDLRTVPRAQPSMRRRPQSTSPSCPGPSRKSGWRLVGRAD